MFHNAQATTFSFIISSVSASALLIIILKSLIEEQNRLFYIWQYRENSYGLWLWWNIELIRVTSDPILSRAPYWFAKQKKVCFYMFDTVNDGTYFGSINMHCSSTLRRRYRANANPPRAWKTGRPVSKLLRVNYHLNFKPTLFKCPNSLFLEKYYRLGHQPWMWTG